MAGLVESNVYGLWVTAQKDKDTPGDDADARKLIHVSGDLDTNRQDGSENWSDGTRFGDITEWVQSIDGAGTPVIEATPLDLEYLLWLFTGQENVTGTTIKSHEFTPGATTGHWSTWFKSVGLSTVHRQQFNAVKQTAIRLEGSTANKVLKYTPTLVSLDPGVHIDADPAADVVKGTVGGADDNRPWIYTEAAGTFKVGGTVFRGHTQFALVISDGGAPLYGDDVVPFDVGPGQPQVSIEGVSLILDDASLAVYNSIVYGDPTPAAGDKPIRNLDDLSYGSWSADFQRNGATTSAQQRCHIELPRVKWNPDVAIAPNPDGGALEIPIGGRVQNDGTNPLWRITTQSNQAAFALPV